MQNAPARERNDPVPPAMMMPFGMTPFSFDAIIEMQRPAFSAMAEFNARLVDAVTTFNTEWTGFINTRLNEDMAVTRQLADSKCVPDVYAVYAEFFQTAVTQYQTEFEQISKIGKTIADDTIHTVQERFEDIRQHPKAA